MDKNEVLKGIEEMLFRCSPEDRNKILNLYEQLFMKASESGKKEQDVIHAIFKQKDNK